MIKIKIITVIFLCLVFADARSQEFDYLNEFDLLNIQMHVHGHSHHNASKKPGTIQWHTHQAAENNVDVVWFTEHDGMLKQNRDLLFNFSGAYIDDSGNINFNRTSNFLPEFLEKKVSNGISKVTVQNDSTIYLELNHNIGKEAQLILSPRTSKGKLAGYRLPRPISSNAVLKFNLNSRFGGLDNVVKVIIELSWHIMEIPFQHSIEYIISDNILVKKHQTVGDNIIQYYLPSNEDEDNQYVLKLYEDASNLLFGQDNTITDIHFVLSCKDSTTISASISNIRLTSLNPDPVHQMEMVNQFSKEYKEIYKVTGISGIEYSPWRKNDIHPHFNLFLPNSKLDFTQIVQALPTDKFNYNELTDRVHTMGGVVSFNHIFGTSFTSNIKYSELTRKSLVDSIASYYMEKDLFNTDILEVGYYSRGGGNLDDHLRIWDIFTSNGYFLYGNGTTDSHGGLWNTEIPNPFTTWIWAHNSMDTSIINALKTGSFYFGPFQSNIKKFNFMIDDFKMGERMYTNRETGKLKIFIDPKPTNYTFRLIQGAIDFPGNDVHYLQNITFDPETPPTLDLSSSCFIRLEVESIADNTRLFSNPIVLLKNDGFQNVVYPDRISIYEKNDEKIIMFSDPYPNPARDIVSIEIPSMNEFKSLRFQLYDIVGNKLSIENKIVFNQNTVEIDIEENPAGMYILIIENQSSALKYNITKL